MDWQKRKDNWDAEEAVSAIRGPSECGAVDGDSAGRFRVLARLPDVNAVPSSRESRTKRPRPEGRMISQSLSTKILLGGGALLVVAAIVLNAFKKTGTGPESGDQPSWQPGSPAASASAAQPGTGSGTTAEPPGGVVSAPGPQTLPSQPGTPNTSWSAELARRNEPINTMNPPGPSGPSPGATGINPPPPQPAWAQPQRTSWAQPPQPTYSQPPQPAWAQPPTCVQPQQPAQPPVGAQPQRPSWTWPMGSPSPTVSTSPGLAPPVAAGSPNPSDGRYSPPASDGRYDGGRSYPGYSRDARPSPGFVSQPQPGSGLLQARPNQPMAVQPTAVMPMTGQPTAMQPMMVRPAGVQPGATAPAAAGNWTPPAPGVARLEGTIAQPPLR